MLIFPSGHRPKMLGPNPNLTLTLNITHFARSPAIVGGTLKLLFFSFLEDDKSSFIITFLAVISIILTILCSFS